MEHFLSTLFAKYFGNRILSFYNFIYKLFSFEWTSIAFDKGRVVVFYVFIVLYHLNHNIVIVFIYKSVSFIVAFASRHSMFVIL